MDPVRLSDRLGDPRPTREATPPGKASRPSRLDCIIDQTNRNLEVTVAMIDRALSIRARLIGPIPSNPDKELARPCRMGHLGKIEDNVEDTNRCLSVLQDILNELSEL